MLVLGGPNATALPEGWRDAGLSVRCLNAPIDLPSELDAALTGGTWTRTIVFARHTRPLVTPQHMIAALDHADVFGSIGVTEPVSGDFRLAGTRAVFGSLVEDEGEVVSLSTWNPVGEARAPWYAVTGPVFGFRREAWEAVPFSALPAETELALFLQWSRTVRELGMSLHVAPAPLGIAQRVGEQRLDSLRRLVQRRHYTTRLGESTSPRKAVPATAGFARERIDVLVRFLGRV